MQNHARNEVIFALPIKVGLDVEVICSEKRIVCQLKRLQPQKTNHGQEKFSPGFVDIPASTGQTVERWTNQFHRNSNKSWKPERQKKNNWSVSHRLEAFVACCLACQSKAHLNDLKDRVIFEAGAGMKLFQSYLFVHLALSNSLCVWIGYFLNGFHSTQCMILDEKWTQF